MKREIKFRAWNPRSGKMITNFDTCVMGISIKGDFYISEFKSVGVASGSLQRLDVMQFTGLKDKNGDGMCIYEGDIVSLHGKVIGNKYEKNELLKDTTNLLIEGFGTAYWRATEKKAMDRGCYYS